jgi:hypothetical protein
MKSFLVYLTILSPRLSKSGYRLNWAGYVLRMDSNLTTKRMFDTSPEGKREIGRPKLRCGDTVV